MNFDLTEEKRGRRQVAGSPRRHHRHVTCPYREIHKSFPRADKTANFKALTECCRTEGQARNLIQEYQRQKDRSSKTQNPPPSPPCSYGGYRSDPEHASVGSQLDDRCLLMNRHMSYHAALLLQGQISSRFSIVLGFILLRTFEDQV
jgi:hypothetical protein